MTTRNGVAAAILLAACGSALGSVNFITSDGSTLYQGSSTSGFGGSTAAADAIRGMETLWTYAGVTVTGAGLGSVIAVSDNPVGGTQGVYRIDNPFSGTPTLVAIGTADQPVSDLAVGDGRLFGVSATGPGGFLKIVEFDADFNTIAEFVTDITHADRGAGGLAYDQDSDTFYLTDPDSDLLWSYQIGGSGVKLGQTSFDFNNNDLALHRNGTLYGSVQDDANGRFLFGTFSTIDGSFTPIDSVGSSLGSVGLAIPAPGAAGLLALGSLAAIRRRR